MNKYTVMIINIFKDRIKELEKENEEHKIHVTENYIYHEEQMDENEIRIKECQYHLKLLKG